MLIRINVWMCHKTIPKTVKNSSRVLLEQQSRLLSPQPQDKNTRYVIVLSFYNANIRVSMGGWLWIPRQWIVCSIGRSMYISTFSETDSEEGLHGNLQPPCFPLANFFVLLDARFSLSALDHNYAGAPWFMLLSLSIEWPSSLRRALNTWLDRAWYGRRPIAYLCMRLNRFSNSSPLRCPTIERV